MGRPSLYTQELGDQICDQLSEGGISLRAICRDLQISYSTVLTWVRDDEAFANQYARARETGDDADFDGLIDLASQPPPTVKGFTDAGWVAWQKNLVEAYKWSLSKRRPKKYGEKTEIEHVGKITLESLVAGSANEQ